jgi:hypothetical protein
MEKFVAKLGILHLLSMLFKSTCRLHPCHVPLAQDVYGLPVHIRRSPEKTAPPFRPVFAKGHTILPY